METAKEFMKESTVKERPEADRIYVSNLYQWLVEKQKEIEEKSTDGLIGCRCYKCKAKIETRKKKLQSEAWKELCEALK